MENVESQRQGANVYAERVDEFRALSESDNIRRTKKMHGMTSAKEGGSLESFNTMKPVTSLDTTLSICPQQQPHLWHLVFFVVPRSCLQAHPFSGISSQVKGS